MRKVYADNCSTAFPKAPGVSEAMKDFLDKTGCNVNRGGYNDSYDVAGEILEVRGMLARFFHVTNPQEVIFTPSVTYSLNMLLLGYLHEGDHVITTSMEHNSVMRPLHVLSQRGVAYDTVPCDLEGYMHPKDILPLIKSNTKAVVMIHASNVCGTVLPLEEVAEICRKHGLRLLVDTAQTAGIIDIDAGIIDGLAFAGHKGFFGPQGIGGLVIKKDFAEEVAPLITGGTGSLSHGIEQPGFLPDKYESGTMNIPAILGLKKALQFVNTTGIDTIYDWEMQLAEAFMEQTKALAGVRLIGKKGRQGRVAVVSLDFADLDHGAIADVLDRHYGIMTRCGLHCAPIAHKSLHTYPKGTVRFSFGFGNTMDEVGYMVRSLDEIVKKGADYGF